MNIIYLVFGIRENLKPDLLYVKAFNNLEDAQSYEQSMSNKLNNEGVKIYMQIREVELINVLNAPKIIISNWASELYMKGKMSNRLHNLLTNNRYFGSYHLDELTYPEFNKYRNTGQVTWKEFVKLRGY